MASNEGNVAALEVDGNNHPNVETLTDTAVAPTTTTTTTTAVLETAADSIPAPSSSTEPAAETLTTAPKDAPVESAMVSETPKEKKDTEESSTSQTATAAAPPPPAESTAEDVPAATVIATPSTTTTQPTDGPKTEGPEAVTEEGESSDQTQPGKETAEEAGPELVITLLLTTGARHPFRIDRKYLKRRSVKVENDDPFNMSVYTLKELIWREWRSGMSNRQQHSWYSGVLTNWDIDRMGTATVIT